MRFWFSKLVFFSNTIYSKMYFVFFKDFNRFLLLRILCQKKNKLIFCLSGTGGGGGVPKIMFVSKRQKMSIFCHRFLVTVWCSFKKTFCRMLSVLWNTILIGDCSGSLQHKIFNSLQFCSLCRYIKVFSVIDI